MQEQFKQRPLVRVIELLEGYLLEHQLAPGARLPAERILCEQWDVSRATLRSGIAKMVQDGHLVTKIGSGTYRAQPKYTRRLQGLLSLGQSAQSQGYQVTTKVLSFTREESDKRLSQHFGCMLGHHLFKIVRLRCIDDNPIMIESSFLLADRVPGLQDVDLSSVSLFATLEQTYGIVPNHGEEKISVTYATAEEAELMECAEGDPLFWIVSETYDIDGRLIELCRATGRPDRMQLQSTLVRWDIPQVGGNGHEQ